MELSVKLKYAGLCEDLSPKEFLCERGTYLLLYAVIGDAILLRRGTETVIAEGRAYLTSFEEGIRVIGSSVIVLSFISSVGEISELFDRTLRPTERQRRHLGEIFKELEGRMGDRDRYGGDLIIENSLSTLLILLARGGEMEIKEELTLLSEEVKSNAQAVRHYLLENYTSKITLDGLCYIFRTNKTALCKEFRDEYGKTVFEYLHEVRIAEAKRLLRDGVISVTAVSDRLGFESIHYFSRLFKRMIGISPTEYARIEKKKQKLMEEL